jgi:hypothetical protein
VWALKFTQGFIAFSLLAPQLGFLHTYLKSLVGVRTYWKGAFSEHLARVTANLNLKREFKCLRTCTSAQADQSRLSTCAALTWLNCELKPKCVCYRDCVLNRRIRDLSLLFTCFRFPRTANLDCKLWTWAECVLTCVLVDCFDFSRTLDYNLLINSITTLKSI